jgi:phospholipid/cholesterol/gamma-HCH transport system ATP-binding protein
LNRTVDEIVHDNPHRETSVTGPACEPYLELDQASKSFGSALVLDKVSFAVFPGQTLCILGRSGSGKSVSLRLFMGFLKPDSGRVVAAGEDITDLSEDELDRIHQKVTMVFQSGALFDSLPVWENVAFPLRERGHFDEQEICRRVDELLEMVGATCIRDLLPSEVSTGMKRSVAIARALAASPEAVLYDEPTTMVDPLMAHRLGNLIGELKTRVKLTSIVVTHDMQLAEKLGDHIIFLDRAKVIFSGTTAEMERSCEPVVRQFLELDGFDMRALLRTVKLNHKIAV